MAESAFVAHEACPDCGSADNLARYDDGHGYCFGCGRYEHSGAGRPAEHRVAPALLEGEVRPLHARGISAETCRRFRYLVGSDRGKTVQLATYCDSRGVPVAQKVRDADKNFRVVGDLKKAGLFGQHLWKGQGRYIVVTEGEIDALSYAEATDCRWPVVSIPTGSSGAAKAIERSIEFLEGYDKVVLAFDMDEPGRQAAMQAAEVLSPGKALIAEMSEKDANEVLLKHGAGKLSKLPFEARPYRPDDVVAGGDLWDLVSTVPEGSEAVPYPWPALNFKTHGLRRGEIVTLCAGSGVGKSTLCRELEHWLIGQGQTVGVIALEENLRRTALGIMSIEMNLPLHLRFDDVPQAELRRAFDATLGTNRAVLYDHWGSIESQRLMAKVRSMVKMLGVRWIVLDHISIVVSGLAVENERRELDMAMTNLRQLAEELRIGIIVVSHLKRVDGRAFERGGEVRLSDLRGSAALEQLSDIVLAGERDQQSADEGDVLRLRVLKNRWTGLTGLAGQLEYNHTTGRLTAVEEADEFERVADGGDRGSRGSSGEHATERETGDFL